MNLYLLRHAIAAPRRTGTRDKARRLTTKGARRMRRLAVAMREMGLEFDVILSSPYLRARQTAEIVAKEFDAGAKLALDDDLAPGGDLEELINALASRYHQPENVLLVGHDPCLSRLISLLTTGTRRLTLSLKKGGLCKLVAESLRYRRCAELEWLATPKLLLGGED